MPGLKRKLIRYGGGTGLTIPHQLAALVDWHPGDGVVVTVERGRMCIRKRKA